MIGIIFILIHSDSLSFSESPDYLCSLFKCWDLYIPETARGVLETFKECAHRPDGIVEWAKGYQSHLQSRETQDLEFEKVMHPGHMPSDEMGVVLDFGEIKSLPRGAKLHSEEWYAHNRKGCSTYVSQIVLPRLTIHVVLISRVLEKTSIYLCACLRETLLRVQSRLSGFVARKGHHWMDGSRQNKSRTVIGPA